MCKFMSRKSAHLRGRELLPLADTKRLSCGVPGSAPKDYPPFFNSSSKELSMKTMK